MNSSGHRANILNADYTRIGVGIRGRRELLDPAVPGVISRIFSGVMVVFVRGTGYNGREKRVPRPQTGGADPPQAKAPRRTKET